jgi:hypothetical protein
MRALQQAIVMPPPIELPKKGAVERIRKVRVKQIQ